MTSLSKLTAEDTLDSAILAICGCRGRPGFCQPPGGKGWWVECGRCGVGTKICGTRETARKTWDESMSKIDPRLYAWMKALAEFARHREGCDWYKPRETVNSPDICNCGLLNIYEGKQ